MSGAAAGRFALAWDTPAGWAEEAATDLLALLQDHAQCELKAAASALGLVKRNPGRPGLALRLMPLVREESEHLHRVLRELDARGAGIGFDQPSPYATGLRRACRGAGRAGEELLDQLLLSALIELRSHERMALLHDAGAPALEPLRPLYRALLEAEARHGDLFLELALAHHEPERVQVRFERLAAVEAELIAGLPCGPRMHSGPPAPH